jgi:IS5 family transposase
MPGLTEERAAKNKKMSKTRLRVEHVFDYQANSMRGRILRAVSLARTTTKIALTNLVPNTY